ncbi:hypothetical protein D3C83_69590 [compost metagenome]
MYQIHVRWNPATRASRIAGMAAIRMRNVDVASGGMVLPSAWNMLDDTKVMPDGTNVTTTIRRYSTPTAMASASFVKTRMIAAAPENIATPMSSM